MVAGQRLLTAEVSGWERVGGKLRLEAQPRASSTSVLSCPYFLPSMSQCSANLASSSPAPSINTTSIWPPPNPSDLEILEPLTAEPYAKQCLSSQRPCEAGTIVPFLRGGNLGSETIVSEGCFLFSWREGGAKGCANSVAKPGPAHTPPRSHPDTAPQRGPPGGPCFPAQRVMELRDWAGRKDWVGLPPVERPLVGVALTGRGLGHRPFPRAQSGWLQRGRGESTAADPSAVLWSPPQAAPRRGRAGTSDRAGGSRLGQLGTGSCWGPKRALGVVASTELPLAGRGPCP